MFCEGGAPRAIMFADVTALIEHQNAVLQDGRYHTPNGITEGLRRGIKRATDTEPWPREQNDDPWEIGDRLRELRDGGLSVSLALPGAEKHLSHPLRLPAHPS